MSAKHGANSWEDYLAVHASRIADFSGHFIVEDRLLFTRTSAGVYWEGVLLCADGIEIHVRKRQLTSSRAGRLWVQTSDYSYQVLRRGHGKTKPLFRYDNAPHHAHPDAHHRHRYDANGVEILPPEHVGQSGWPTLGEVIEEAFEMARPAR
jgi:hypothetical protein